MKRARFIPAEESELRAEFYREVSDVLRNARARAHRAVNVAMVEAYWNVGRLTREFGCGEMGHTMCDLLT